MNSIPLIKGNTPQEINTSIIALKKALSELEAQDRLLQGTDKDVQDKIKQINELIEGINTHLGTVDSHLDTIDNQITALQPVDTVTSGNMHSVTSNAVADALSGKVNTNTYTDTNLNTLINTGFYVVGWSSQSWDNLNFPINHFGTVLVGTTPSGNLTQTFMSDDGQLVYVRNCTTNVWSSWKKVLTTNDSTISRWYFPTGFQSAGILPVVNDGYNDNPNIYLDGNKFKFRGNARYLVIVHIIGQVEGSNRLFFRVEGLNFDVYGINYGEFAECDIVFPTEVTANTEIYVNMLESFRIGGGGLVNSYIAFSPI